MKVKRKLRATSVSGGPGFDLRKVEMLGMNCSSDLPHQTKVYNWYLAYVERTRVNTTLHRNVCEHI